jgi:hypothetical protein
MEPGELSVGVMYFKNDIIASESGALGDGMGIH